VCRCFHGSQGHQTSVKGPHFPMPHCGILGKRMAEPIGNDAGKMVENLCISRRLEGCRWPHLLSAKSNRVQPQPLCWRLHRLKHSQSSGRECYCSVVMRDTFRAAVSSRDAHSAAVTDINNLTTQ
jgi:hypothetical protein